MRPLPPKRIPCPCLICEAERELKMHQYALYWADDLNWYDQNGISYPYGTGRVSVFGPTHARHAPALRSSPLDNGPALAPCPRAHMDPPACPACCAGRRVARQET